MNSVLDGIQIIVNDDDEDNIDGTMMDIVNVLVVRCWCMRYTSTTHGVVRPCHGGSCSEDDDREHHKRKQDFGACEIIKMIIMN